MREVGAALGALLVCYAGASAQAVTNRDTVVLTLRDAVVRSARTSEEVRLAQSQVDLAGAQVRTVRADALPQLSGTLGYTRTFESQFNTGSAFTIPDSLRFEPDSLAPLPDRVSYLEQRVPTAGLGGLGSLFGDLPFGRENGYTAILNGSQTVFSPRLGSALRAAREFREAAGLNLREQLAEIELRVRTAYHQALLASELEQISVAALEQAEKFLAQERLREKSGAGSELDVLRAEVAAANLRPQLIAAQNSAQIALLDLRRLVNVPATQPLKLVTELAVPSADQMRDWPSDSVALLQNRPALAAAERGVRMRELGVRIAKSEYLPTASVNLYYGRIAYPVDPFNFGWNEWRTDFTATISVAVPIFNGLRREAGI
ncbi:MAG TPA: TolC family protein, partial [Longimicrobiales bacterium]|nr:TolC family protein [Longimicrobiales bacterium]